MFQVMRCWFLVTAVIIIYCEYIADYVKLWKCKWPNLKITNNEETLHAMILADTHLLGPFNGHWLDKLYREWHMSRAFQTSMYLLKPDIIFVLGDLFDEGQIVNDSQFNEYVDRFHKHFHPPIDTIMISAAGNHDIGFHYRMRPYLVPRFHKNFNNTGVNLYTKKGIHFVVINSMAMQNDRCDFCQRALNELNDIASLLDCLKTSRNCSNRGLLTEKNAQYSRPIVMQHFPTYRISDAVCRETDAPIIERFRENWEVLSKESTNLLAKLLKPRLAFAGHIHHYCHSITNWGVDEYTVASFSWRNKINPSFMLSTLSTEQYAVLKCDMLQQNTVFFIYTVYVISAILFLIYQSFIKLYKFRRLYRYL